MTEQKEEKKEGHLAENLSAVGQIILGEIEAIGGILTADPITRAEGAFNVEEGLAHQKANRELEATEKNIETETNDEK